jgi:DNA-binding response OmpR family regulator
MALVLVIDDEPAMRNMIERIARTEGHEVVAACDGNEGLALCVARRPDIVITDIIMPDREGIETIREMRRAHPSVRIIAVSGAPTLNGVSFLELAKKAGADAGVQKPFRAAELIAAVKSVNSDQAKSPFRA